MNSKCFFYRKVDHKKYCAYNNEWRWCFFCLDFMVPIEDLSKKEMYSLNENRRGRKLTILVLFVSVVFSTLSLIISVINLFLSQHK